MYYRGLNNYQYYFGGVPYYEYSKGAPNPILIIKTPTLVECPTLKGLYGRTIDLKSYGEASQALNPKAQAPNPIPTVDDMNPALPMI